MPKALHAETLVGLSGIAHGFFTRRGGVSKSIYASLNCGVGSKDDAAAVRENRARVTSHLGGRSLLTCHQVHSAKALVVDEPWLDQQRPKADAMVTRERGLVLGVLTADCAPVLVADAGARVVGAAHAGWRGALGGVIEALIAAMESIGARKQHLCAAVGPCIGQSAYEVGFDFKDEFVRRDAGSIAFFADPGDSRRPHFDLSGYAARRLVDAGVATERFTTCTYAQGDNFFSFRRSQSDNESDYGRQISAIVLT
jgi:YfiH family protein